MNEFESLLSQDLDFAKNKSNRIMICLCIDCSASMLRQGAMKKVNDGMAAFLEKTNSDTLSRDAADICIVSSEIPRSLSVISARRKKPCATCGHSPSCPLALTQCWRQASI